jgi:hypothetical protein
MLIIDLKLSPPTSTAVENERNFLAGLRRQYLLLTFALLLVLATGTWMFKEVPMTTSSAWPVVCFEVLMALSLVGVLNVFQLCSIHLDALEPATESQLDLVESALSFPVVALYVAEVRHQGRQLTRAEAAAIAGYILRERRRDEEEQTSRRRRKNMQQLVAAMTDRKPPRKS